MQSEDRQEERTVEVRDRDGSGEVERLVAIFEARSAEVLGF
jgi:hypothetical protein